MKSYRFELILVFSALGLLGLAFLGILSGSFNLNNLNRRTNTPAEVVPASTLERDIPLTQRFSEGQQSLLPDPSEAKLQGINAYSEGSYDLAVDQFEATLKENRNDPEAFIYLNNALVGEQPAHTIAVIAPIGDKSEIGLEILRGAGQAQQMINQAGGIEGIPLKILIVNDDNDAKTAISVAQALIEQPKVLGVLGHYSSGVTLAAAPIYHRGELPMVSAISTSVELSGFSPYIFRTVPSDSFAAAALARYMIEDLQAEKAILYYDSNSAYSLSLKSEFSTSVFSDGGEILTEYDLAASDFDAQEQIESAQEQGVDVVMLAASTDTLDPSLEVMTAVGQDISLLGGDDLYHPTVLSDGGEDAQDLVVAVPWHVLSDPDSEFVSVSREIWGGDVSWRSAMAYDAFTALAYALTEDPTREGVRQTLENSDFSTEGATGEIRFLPSGDRNRAAQLVQVQAGERSGLGYDFVPVP